MKRICFIFSLLFLLVSCSTEDLYYNPSNLYAHNVDGTDYTIERDIYDRVKIQGWNGYICSDVYEIEEHDGEIRITITLNNLLEEDG